MGEDQPSKASFFAALEQLDDLDNQSEEEDPLERLIAPSRTLNIPNRTAASALAHPEPASLLRAQSDPQPSPTDTRHSDSIVVEELQHRRSETISEPKPRTVKRSETIAAMPGTKTRGPPPSKKRKTNSIKMLPEEQQIFKEFIFFFFPNNDSSPLRRLRIQRVQEYGAQWAREWTNSITHVIVEKWLSFQNVLKHLKLESLPTNLILVNDTYPSDCIRFRSVISPSQARFRVDGVPAPVQNEKPTPAVAEPRSADMLQLKLSKREQQQQSTQPSQSQPGTSAAATLPVSEVVVSESIPDAAPARERDALDDIIDEAIAVQHLPLDPLKSPEESDGDESDKDSTVSSDSDPEKHKEKPRKDRRTVESWAQSFACMQKFDPNAQRNNPNSRTIEVLQQMLEYYTRTGDHWRTLAYRKAINALRRQPLQIMTRKEALSITGIGPRLADKIEEIVLTNHLRRLDHTNETAEDRVIQEFLGVYGAGLTQASKWVAQGYRSLRDLQDRAPLTKNQRIGVERYHDFAQRIPRKEVEAHGAIVRQAVQEVDSDMQVIIGGSYRRGALDSGDIDLLITKPDASLEQIRVVIMETVVPQLFQNGFLQVGLATSRQGHDGSKWHGACLLPGGSLWRRIDLLFVPWAELGAALIYFTGNDIFNRSMRLLARKKGMCLNQRGLFTNVLRDAQRVKTNPGRLVESRDERRIFTVLGVPWRRPEHRME